MRRTCASIVATALVVLVLAPSPGIAAPRSVGRAAADRTAIGGSLFWDAAWIGFPALAALWEKIGLCGGSHSLIGRPQPDARKIGPSMDPNGQPLTIPADPELLGEMGLRLGPGGR